MNIRRQRPAPLSLLAIAAAVLMALFLVSRIGILPAASAGDDVWYDDAAWSLLHDGVLRRPIHANATGDGLRDFLPPLTATLTAGAFALLGPTAFAVGLVPTLSVAIGIALLAAALRRRTGMPLPLAWGLAVAPFFTPHLLKIAGHNRFEAQVFALLAASLFAAASRDPGRTAPDRRRLLLAGLAAGGAVAAHYPAAPFILVLTALWACADVRALLPFGAGVAAAGLAGLAWIGGDLPLFIDQMVASHARYTGALERERVDVLLVGAVALACCAVTWRAGPARRFAGFAIAAVLVQPLWPTNALLYPAVAVVLALAPALARPSPPAGAAGLAAALFVAVATVSLVATAGGIAARPTRDYPAFARHLRSVLPATRDGLILIDRPAHLALRPCYGAAQLHHMVAANAPTLPSRVLLDVRALDRVAAVVIDPAAVADHRAYLPLVGAFLARPHRVIRVTSAGIDAAAGAMIGPYAVMVALPVTDRGSRLSRDCR